MPDPEKPEVVIEEPPATAAGVDVDLTKKPDQAPEKKPGETESQYLQRLEAIGKDTYANRRAWEKISKDMEALKQRLEAPKPVPSEPASAPAADELDKLVEQGRWKEAVSKLAAQQAEQVFQQREFMTKRDQALRQYKEDVIAEFPQLHPETGNADDPFAQVYMRVVEQHPEWYMREDGPLLALHEAKKVAQSEGITPSKAAQPAAAPNQEIIRRGRANTASLPPGRTGITNDNVIRLTAEEKVMCDRMKIPYETFARNKRALETGGGIEG